MIPQTALRLIGGRYEVERRLGSGGMADVFLAMDRKLARRVAVKLLRPPYSSDPELLARFERESRAAAALSHPHVVGVFDADATSGAAFLVMEYVTGSTLRDLLARRGPLPEAEALELAAQVADGLDAIHGAGLVHLDVKPANVLLDANGRAKITDFGIALLERDRAPLAGAIMGTAYYLSPERAQGQPADTRSDLYSLGIVLFELLTGAPPFRGNDAEAVMRQHIDEPVPSMKKSRPDVSEATDAAVRRALQKLPADRFTSAAAMRRTLLAAKPSGDAATLPLLGVPVLAGWAASASRVGGRRRLVAGLTVVGLLVLALAGFARARGADSGLPGFALAAAARTPAATLARLASPPSAPATVPAPTAAPGPATSAPTAGQSAPSPPPVAAQPPATPARAALVLVPDLAGVDEARVGAILASAGLAPGPVTRAPSSTVRTGLVARQTPAAGTRVQAGAQVAVVLSGGRPATATPLPPPAPARSGEGSPPRPTQDNRGGDQGGD